MSPSTLAVSPWVRVLASASDVRMPRSTGLKSRLRACATRRSRSRPAAVSSRRVAPSVVQARTCRRGSGPAGSSNCSPVHEFCTTCQPYPADGVVWMMIAPTAPARAALSYLYDCLLYTSDAADEED